MSLLFKHLLEEQVEDTAAQKASQTALDQQSKRKELLRKVNAGTATATANDARGVWI